MREKILVVDDEKDIVDIIEFYLKNENYEVIKSYSASEALEHIYGEEIELAILDIMMPEIDGMKLCRKIRENYNFPIIMLTARVNDLDKINGLTMGADDYVTKPFKPLELVARVKAQLRRYNNYGINKKYDTKKAEDGKIIIRELSLNIITHQCFLRGEEVLLTPTEFSILKLLCQNLGEVISGEKLFHSLWKDEYYSKSNNTITVHIRNIREKLNDTVEKPRYIKTVWGVGYKIEG